MISEDLETTIWSMLDYLRRELPLDRAFGLTVGLILLKYLDDHADLGEGKSKANAFDFTIPAPSRWSVFMPDYSPKAIADSARLLAESPNNQDLSYILTTLGVTEFDRLLEHSPPFESLIGTIDQINTTDINFGASFGRFLENFSKRLGSRSGGFSTPISLTNLAVALLAPKPNETVFDPVCGIGNFLVVVEESIRQEAGPMPIAQVYGQDINGQSVALAKVNLIFHGLTPNSICLGDSLVEPCFVDDTHLRQFDCVIADPPINALLSENRVTQLRYDPFGRSRFGSVGRNANFAFIQHIIASLNDHGRAVILTALGPLFVGGADGEIRKHIIEADLIEAIITLPSQLRFETGMPTAVLILNKRKSDLLNRRILFVHAQEEYEVKNSKPELGPENRSKIIRTYRYLEERQRFSRIVELGEVVQNEFQLMPTRYIDISGITTFLGGKVEWEKLVPLAQVFQGSKLGQLSETGATRYIRGRDLTTPNLDLADLETTDSVDIANPIYTETNDILLQRIGQTPRAFLVSDNLKDVLVSETAYVIRLAQAKQYVANFLVDFLNSDIGTSLLWRTVGNAVVPTVRLKDLRELKVPIPEKAVLDLLANIHNVESRFLTRLNQARNLRERLFGIEDPEKASTQLIELNNEASVLAASLDQSQDLDFQIRNFYPFPLAFAYRTLGAILDPYQLYPEQLRVAENILAFLGSVGLATAIHKGFTISSDNAGPTMKQLPQKWQSGISPGDWQALGRETASILRAQPDSAFAEQFSSCWFRGTGKKESEFAQLTKKLVERKNHFKHDRGPKTQQEVEDATQELEHYLREVMASLSFFIQTPLRFVEGVDIEWKSKRATLETLVYMGDHPGLRPERVSLSSAVPRGKLYLEIQPEVWIPLYPLVSVLYCPSCKTRETYFVDRWEGLGHQILLKSFERGHTRENDKDANQVSEHLSYFLHTKASDDFSRRDT